MRSRARGLPKALRIRNSLVRGMICFWPKGPKLRILRTKLRCKRTSERWISVLSRPTTSMTAEWAWPSRSLICSTSWAWSRRTRCILHLSTPKMRRKARKTMTRSKSRRRPRISWNWRSNMCHKSSRRKLLSQTISRNLSAERASKWTVSSKRQRFLSKIFSKMKTRKGPRISESG
mgnify:CR=1 FL=1